MSEIIQLQKTIYSRGINKVTNTEFNQLIPQKVEVSPLKPDLTVSEFFNQYNTLFYEIPLSGSDESHLGLANKSLDHIGLSLDDMQAEIEYLRQENVELKNQIIQISKIDVGTLEEL